MIHAGKLDVTDGSAALPDQLPAVMVTGLYVHVPFCVHKCHYCDFYSITHQPAERMERFVELVLAEARRWADAKRGPEIHPQTIFFGGGTPTLLPRSAMERLVTGLRQCFGFEEVDEWTVEANPATVSAEYCAMLREHGVDRLSFGGQSFREAELRMLERHHRPEEAQQSIAIARSAGFRRLNLDLIYGIPGQDLEAWLANLDAAIALGTEHLSCYGLTYEPNTALTAKKRLGQITPVDDAVELRMMHETRARLAAAGLAAYEISNYARPGEECRHNLLYWNGGDYIGLGPAAASHVQGWRWRNRPHLGKWEEAVAGGGEPAIEVEHLSPPRRAGELAMLQLRLTRGVDFADFAGRTGCDARLVYADLLAELARHKLIETDQCGFHLTDTGLNVADAVAAEFLSVSDDDPAA